MEDAFRVKVKLGSGSVQGCISALRGRLQFNLDVKVHSKFEIFLDCPLCHFWTVQFDTSIHSKDRPLLIHDRPL